MYIFFKGGFFFCKGVNFFKICNNKKKKALYCVRVVVRKRDKEEEGGMLSIK